jgi:hypothetical protein
MTSPETRPSDFPADARSAEFPAVGARPSDFSSGGGRPSDFSPGGSRPSDFSSGGSRPSVASGGPRPSEFPSGGPRPPSEFASGGPRSSDFRAADSQTSEFAAADTQPADFADGQPSEFAAAEARPRRSAGVALLDGALRVFAALQAGPTPTPKIVDGRRRGIGRYLLLTGVLAALVGTALLVVVLVRAPGDPTPPPDPAAALPGLRSRPAGPSAAGSASSTVSSPATTPGSPAATSALGGAATATQIAPSTGAASSAGGAPITEATQVPLTASYKTASATAGLLGYQMTVTVANPGSTARNGWTLTVTLPRPTLLVAGVQGATATQNGSVWTFTPDATTSAVPAGGSVKVVFGVHGATLLDAAPKDCRIDGNPCHA